MVRRYLERGTLLAIWEINVVTKVVHDFSNSIKCRGGKCLLIDWESYGVKYLCVSLEYHSIVVVAF